MIEMQERYIDNEIVEKVCMLPIRGITPELVTDAINTYNENSNYKNSLKHDLKVAYELLLDEKRLLLLFINIILLLIILF